MKKILRYASQTSILGISLAVGLAGNAEALTLTPTNSGSDLANTIVGEGITVTPGSINYTGGDGAAAFFDEGMTSGIGIESGIILTTGQASDAAGPNNADGTGSSNAGGGDEDLASLVPGFNINDASVLEFDFESEGGDLFFDFVFASEEYNEFVNSSFNDVFGFFLDGENIAVIPGTETPLAIDNVNLEVNSQFYNNNDLSDGGPFFDLEYDGFTNVLTAQALDLSPGTHTIKLAVGDAGDSILDSAVFIGANSFADVEDPVIDPVDPVEPPVTPTPDTATTPEPGSLLSLLAVGLVGSGSLMKRNGSHN